MLLSIWLAPLCLASETRVQICLGDGNEWPPYTYWERVDGEVDRERLTGSASVLVLTVLQRLQLDYRVRYMPWARVQQEVAEFASRGRCELTWDASYNEERATYAHFSEPLYQTSLGLFYSQRRFLSEPSAALLQLQHYRLCGVIGYNYQAYSIDWEIQRFPSLQQNLDMLLRQRCDFFPSEIEPLYGGIALGAYRAGHELRHLRLPGHKAFYLMLSRGSPRGEALIAAINRELQALEASGEAEAIRQRFLPPGVE